MEFQEVQELRAKRDQVLAELHNVEDHYLQQLGRWYSAGELDMADLADAYEEFKDGAAPGFSKHWNELVPVNAKTVQTFIRQAALYAPNVCPGSWEGSYPIGLASRPRKGVPVVYWLYDSNGVCCYIGSTKNLKVRLKQHHSDGKRFVSWRAYECASRKDAYNLEDVLLKNDKPYLNKRAAA